MLLNFNDPESIVAWWTVLPEEHKLQASPQFRPSINEARRRIAARPELSGLLDAAVQRRRQHEFEQAARTARMTSLQLRHQELTTA